MWRIAVIAAGMATLAARASAQVPGADKDESARLFQEANTLRDAGRFAEACDRFARSYVLDRAVGTELNLADCAERQSQLGRAWHLYDEAAREAERQGNAPSATYARDHAAALVPKLAQIVVHLAEPRPAHLVIKIGGREVLAAAEISRFDDPGAIDIDVTAPGARPFHETAHTTRGETTTIEVPALAPLGAPNMVMPPPPPHVVGPSTETRRDRTRVKIAYGVGSVGGVALGFSLLYALHARSTYTDDLRHAGCSGPDNRTCPGDVATASLAQSAFHDESDRMRVADGFAIGGVVLVGVAAAIYFTAPHETITIAPIATATSAGVGLTGSF